MNIIPVPYQEIKLSHCQFGRYQIFFLINFSYLSCWQLFNNHWHTIRILSSNFLSWKLTSILNISMLKCKVEDMKKGSFSLQYLKLLPSSFLFSKGFSLWYCHFILLCNEGNDFISSLPAGVNSPNILGSSEKNYLTYQYLRKYNQN